MSVSATTSESTQQVAVALDRGIGEALRWLTAAQSPEGSWAGCLQTNACIEAEWLLAFHVLEHEYPHAPALTRGILSRQRPDGAWETYFQAPAGDINATVECYAALRLSGLSPDDEAMRRARSWILGNGGLQNVRVFTRYWLALIGEWPWQATPNLPPEIIFAPDRFPFSIYRFASWARATLVPLAVLSAIRHVRPLPGKKRLDELFPGGRDRFDFGLPRRGDRFSPESLFRIADRALHRLQALRLTPGRETAIRRCVDWIVAHQDADGSWGGIQPPWIYSLMALRARGFALEHPVLSKGLGALDTHWSWENDEGRYIQASDSAVWDTMLSLTALAEAGACPADSNAMCRGLDWLLDREVRFAGDWARSLPDVEPGGWAFERANLHYPDVDDTAVAVTLLARFKDVGRVRDALDRAVKWLLAMQSRNGGWAAFDRNNDRALLARIPFSDFGEILDPPSADVTAHVLEALGATGRDSRDPVVARGLEFLKREQEPAGGWFGRWGVNHIYGTGAVLPALSAVGEPMNARYVRRAGEWLAGCQNSDGGWGESCASYMDPAQIGRGTSTASQTAWAMLGLMAVDFRAYRDLLARAAGYLLSEMVGGSWDEPQYTGTGFPGYGVGARTALDDPGLAERLGQGGELQRGFMINYGLYRHYFPLIALARYRTMLSARQ